MQDLTKNNDSDERIVSSADISVGVKTHLVGDDGSSALQQATAPMHAGVTNTIASTPNYFRLLLAGLPGRYAFRGTIGSLSAFEPFGPLKKSIDKRWDIIESYYRNPSDKAAKIKAHDILARDGYLWRAEAKLEEGKSSFLNRGMSKDYDYYRRGVKKKIKRNILNKTYDSLLGVGSIYLTTTYELGVYQDIKNIFSEAVAYEFDKPAESITFNDLRHSNNEMVQSTLDVFYHKAGSRFGTDILFFGRHLSSLHPKLRFMNKIEFGDIMIGVKGLQLLSNIANREPIIFETLRGFIDQKINTIHGLGEPITASDMIDIYQRYTIDHHPEKAFHDTTMSQSNDNMDWRKSKIIFSKIANLMNISYKYKPSNKQIENRFAREPDRKVYFTLPKFIYLLGNNLIDLDNPELTYTYVELAATKGMKAVKDARNIVRMGGTYEDIVEKYNLDISDILKLNGKSVYEDMNGNGAYFDIDEKISRERISSNGHHQQPSNIVSPAKSRGRVQEARELSSASRDMH